MTVVLGILVTALTGAVVVLGWLWWKNRQACSTFEARTRDLEGRLTQAQADRAAAIHSAKDEHHTVTKEAEEAGAAVEAASGDAVAVNFDSAFTPGDD